VEANSMMMLNFATNAERKLLRRNNK